MINLWDYNDAKIIRLTTNDNSVYEGKIIELTEKEEQSDLCPFEDSIALSVKKRCNC